jgi:DNA-binding Lrp family transcriptional regulator
MATQTEAAVSKASMEPIQALNRLLDIITGYCAAQAFLSACKLNIFEELSQGPTSAEDLARRVNIHPVGCRRLLAALAKLGLVERDGEFFRNSELGHFCTSKSAVNLEAISGFGEPFYHMFEYLPDALREYSPRWQQALGTSHEDVFGALYEDPARLQRFAQFMNAMSVPQGQEIAKHFDFAPHTCIMDVAGGPGGQAIQIGLRHTHLGGIIIDMAPVCEIAKEQIQRNGLSGRFTAVPADLFEGPYPQGADVIVLGHILHDWSDNNCLKILRNCSAALPSRGVLLISETVLNPDFSNSTFGLMKDLTMMVACESGARERTEAEYRSLLGETGFEFAETIRLDAPRDLIVAHKR